MNKLHFLSWMLLIVLLSGITGTAFMQSDDDFPLAAHGTFVASKRTLQFTDEARDGRVITVSLWYPAIMPTDKLDKLPKLQEANMAIPDLLPDTSSAPYPVVLYSHGYTGGRDELMMVLEPLVTHGFIVAAVQHLDDTSARTLIDRPLDIRFAIDHLEEVNASGDLAGLMTLDQVGLIGTSDGGYTALTMTGARIDEAFMSQWGTGEHVLGDLTDADPRNVYSDWDWNMLKAYYDRFMPPADDELLQPLSDPRIGAIVSYLPCFANVFGERGLTAATVPTLLIAATSDTFCPYAIDAVLGYEHLGSPEHELLSLVGAQHDVPMDEYEAPVTHMTAAFFGYHLQGITDDAAYLTADFVDQFEQLHWGVVTP